MLYTIAIDALGFEVLILVLVEDGLGEVISSDFSAKYTGLNPCFSGGWSRSIKCTEAQYNLDIVLILVLVEDGLGETDKTIQSIHSLVS